MRITNIHDAKTHLSRYVEMAFAGEEVIICKSGKPMAKLVPYKEGLEPRVPGRLKDKIWIAPDFDEIPKDIIKDFSGEQE